MVIEPKEKPVISNLNSYYLDLEKLIEHFQGEIGAGGVFFNSPSARAVVFFDQEEILNGCLRDKGGELTGKAAVERLIKGDFDHNFKVDIYHISLEEVYFWLNEYNKIK